MTPLYLAGWPLRRANSLRQLSRARWPRLPRPVISIGNIASGGRGKTPMTAALALAAAERGLRPAILSRGYKGAVSSRRPALTLIGEDQEGPCWRRTLSDGTEERVAPQWSLVSGDEAAWLAATCTGVPVGVHPDRSRSASAILQRYDVDLFLLDDGFQTVLYRDLDLVLLDPREDPPFARRSLCREGPGALRRAHCTAVILGAREPAEEAVRAWPQLVRTATSLSLLDSGETTSIDTDRGVVVAAAVAQPHSVAALAREFGLTVSREVAIRDHGELSRAAWREIEDYGAPLLVTEKDAVGWAGRQRPPGPSALVLSMRLAGASALANKLLDELQAGAPS